VHGHTPVMEPDFRSNRINIDTGAFATNRLTCLRIGEDGARVLCFIESNSKAHLGSRSDPYAALGVDRNATLREIRAAYIRLVKDLHPDTRSHRPFADEQLKEINSAYQDLKNLHRLSGPRQSDPGFFARPSSVFAISFLISVTFLLAIFGGIYRGGLIGSDPAAPVKAPGQTPAQITSVEEASDTAADPATLAAANDAAWAAAEREGTSEALRRYLEQFPSSRHASQASMRMAMVAMSEVALHVVPERRDKAAIAEARTALRRYLDNYPNGQLATEVHTKLAAIDAAEAAVLADEAAWTHARRIGTREALLQYLSAYPHGLNQVEARNAVTAIESAEERAAWTAAQEAGTVAALRAYLSSRPNGSNAAAALQMLATLSAAEQERDRDDAAWSKAQQDNTKAAFSDYLATHPKGRHVQSALTRLASLKSGEAKAPPDSAVTSTKQAAPGDVKANRPAAHRWPSADEPFVGADGRIR
jgi:DnaJ-domain-containing protein 1